MAAKVRLPPSCNPRAASRRAYHSSSSRLRAYKELRARQTELNLAIQAERAASSRVYEDTTEANADRVNRLVRAASQLGN